MWVDLTGREGVEASNNRRCFVDKNEDGAEPAALVLPGLLPKVSVERLDATGEGRAVVPVVERHDPHVALAHALFADNVAVTLKGLSQGFVRLRWIKQRFKEDDAVARG